MQHFKFLLLHYISVKLFFSFVTNCLFYLHVLSSLQYFRNKNGIIDANTISYWSRKIKSASRYISLTDFGISLAIFVTRYEKTRLNAQKLETEIYVFLK